MTLTPRVFLSTVALCALVLLPAARADIIDVEGEGVLDGTVVESDREKLVFLDSYGNLKTFPQSRVTVLDSARPQGPARSALADAGRRAQEWGDRAGRLRESVAGVMARPESAATEYHRGIESSLGWLRLRLAALRRAALAEFYRGVNVERVLQSLVPDFTRRLERFGEGAVWATAAAVFLAVLGLAASGYTLIRLVFFYFERGIWRGVAGLSLLAVPFAGWLGGLLGDAVAVVPILLNAYLLAAFWGDVRRWVVGLVFAVDATLFGYCLIRMFA